MFTNRFDENLHSSDRETEDTRSGSRRREGLRDLLRKPRKAAFYLDFDVEDNYFEIADKEAGNRFARGGNDEFKEPTPSSSGSYRDSDLSARLHDMRDVSPCREMETRRTRDHGSFDSSGYTSSSGSSYGGGGGGGHYIGARRGRSVSTTSTTLSSSSGSHSRFEDDDEDLCLSADNATATELRVQQPSEYSSSRRRPRRGRRRAHRRRSGLQTEL